MTISLCWIERCELTRIQPLRTLDEMLAQANSTDGKHGDSRANLVRLNWMVENLRRDRLRKPILVNNDWQVIVGDTRLMALNLLGRTHAPVLAQLSQPRGVVMLDQEDLRYHCGFRAVDVITDPVDADIFQDPVSWAEFIDPDSSHHMHDESQRARMIERYLVTQRQDFRFTREWCLEPIDWSRYD